MREALIVPSWSEVMGAAFLVTLAVYLVSSHLRISAQAARARALGTTGETTETASERIESSTAKTPITETPIAGRPTPETPTARPTHWSPVGVGER